jgi:hypothetical protein
VVVVVLSTYKWTSIYLPPLSPCWDYGCRGSLRLLRLREGGGVFAQHFSLFLCFLSHHHITFRLEGWLARHRAHYSE